MKNRKKAIIRNEPQNTQYQLHCIHIVSHWIAYIETCSTKQIYFSRFDELNCLRLFWLCIVHIKCMLAALLHFFSFCSFVCFFCLSVNRLHITNRYGISFGMNFALENRSAWTNRCNRFKCLINNSINFSYFPFFCSNTIHAHALPPTIIVSFHRSGCIFCHRIGLLTKTIENM